ncbi:MFD4A protein, partial [Polypterus senegalus]
MAVTGLAMGVIDTIANLQLVKIYQKDSAVFLQVLHFFIGLGALVSPLIADPFLSETNCLLSNTTRNTTGTLHHIRHTLSGTTIHNLSRYDLPMDVPVAVFLLMKRERMVPCCNLSSPPLLKKDELALEEQSTDGQSYECAGHGNLFSCCQSEKIKDVPFSFFAIHALGGLVLFMTDGLVVIYSEGSYSFLMCGIIIGCLGALIYLMLFFVQRIHRHSTLGKTCSPSCILEGSKFLSALVNLSLSMGNNMLNQPERLTGS